MMRLEKMNHDMTNIQTNQPKQITHKINELATKVREETDSLSQDSEHVESMVETLNEFIEPLRTNLNFRLHEELEDYYVEVIDQETKEIIREIPPKEMLDMYAKMAELMGIMIDEKI